MSKIKEKEPERDLISIITPVYNSENYIKDTIDSVISQTYTNWELLIADDCSLDKTEEIIRRYDDSRIKYHKLEKNSGAAVARNTVLELAKGNYIAFLDADDMWKPDKLDQQINFMNKNGYGFTFSGYEILRKGQNKIIKVPKSLSYNQFMKNTIIGTLTVMIDRSIIGDVRLVNVEKDHDSMTWARILRQGYKAYGLNESLAYYRKVSGSISNDKFKAVKRHWKNCREIEKLSVLRCLYYFLFYICNAVKKHYF